MYVVAYDICEPRRLRRVARILEKYASRCQKSVFLFRGAANALQDVLDEVAQVIEPQEDLVQAWRLAPQESGTGTWRGAAPCLFPNVAILHEDGVHVIAEDQL